MNPQLAGSPQLQGAAGIPLQAGFGFGQAPNSSALQVQPAPSSGYSINVSGSGNPLDRPATHDGAQVPTNTTSYGTNSSAATTPFGNTDAGRVFQSNFDAQVNNLQAQNNALPAYQNEAANSVRMQYTPQANTLQAQHAQGNSNLDLAQNQLDTNHSSGLRNLGTQLRGTLNGLQQQLGVMGAGDSSANQLLSYGLTQQGNNELNDMNTNFNQQQTGLNLQRHNLEQNYQNQLDTLNAWRDSNLNDIAAKFAQQQQQLQQAIMSARGQEASYLAMYGQTALADQALAQMQALNGQYKDQIGQLNTHFQSANAPVSDISQYTHQPTIQAINPGQLNGLSIGANQATNPTPTAQALLNKRPDQIPAGI